MHGEALPQPTADTSPITSSVPSESLSATDRLGLAAGLWATSVAVCLGSLSLPYFSDDFAVLGSIARFRREGGLLRLLTQAHNEHIIPLLRLLMWVATRLGGFDATPMRLLLLTLHAS